jgi:hypothetical protein
MAHVPQRPLYARVPPTWILRGHSHDEAPNLGEHPGAPWAPPRVRPFPYNQFAMPSKNGVGRHERCHVSQYGPSETLSEHGQAPALRIVQPQSTSRPLVLSVHDSPREETQSHHVARARAIQTAPRAASVTDSRRESTRMCRPSFRHYGVQQVECARAPVFVLRRAQNRDLGAPLTVAGVRVVHLKGHTGAPPSPSAQLPSALRSHAQ